MVRWYSNLLSEDSSKRVLHEDLGGLKWSTSSHMAVGGSRRAVYASTVARGFRNERKKKLLSVEYARRWRPVGNRWQLVGNRRRLVCNQWRLVCNRWRLVGNRWWLVCN